MDRKIWLVAAGLLLAGSLASAKQPGQRVFNQEGNDRITRHVAVTSITAVSPTAGITWPENAGTQDGQERFLRSVSLFNPSTYYIYIGTWTGFSASSHSFVLPNAASGTYTTTNSSTFYMLMQVDVPTVTVRVNINREK